jgi:hypothetical protein
MLPRCIKGVVIFDGLEIIGCGSLRFESEDRLNGFRRRGIETDPEIFGLLDFVRFEYCSMDGMNHFVHLPPDNFYEISASLCATLRTRLVLPGKTERQFPPTMKKGKRIDVSDRIIAHLTRECGGNVHDRRAVDVTSGSFEKETKGANRHSGAHNNHLDYAAKNAADLGTISYFQSDFRSKEEDIPYTRNNWVRYDFKERRELAGGRPRE